MRATELVVDGVTLTAGARRLVQDVSLTARPGEVIGLVGPNGSGKSSLLRAKTAPILPYYEAKGLVRHVDGMAPINAVNRSIEAILDGA